MTGGESGGPRPIDPSVYERVVYEQAARDDPAIAAVLAKAKQRSYAELQGLSLAAIPDTVTHTFFDQHMRIAHLYAVLALGAAIAEGWAAPPPPAGR
jgi:hypothetical protein